MQFNQASDSFPKHAKRGHKGREGQKQGGNDFLKAPCLPKLDRIRPSFEQGAKGAKGRFFEKTFSNPKVFRLSLNRLLTPLTLDKGRISPIALYSTKSLAHHHPEH